MSEPVCALVYLPPPYHGMDPRVRISAFRFQIVTMILSIIAVLLLIAETYLAEKGFYART